MYTTKRNFSIFYGTTAVLKILLMIAIIASLGIFLMLFNSNDYFTNLVSPAYLNSLFFKPILITGTVLFLIIIIQLPFFKHHGQILARREKNIFKKKYGKTFSHNSYRYVKWIFVFLLIAYLAGFEYFQVYYSNFFELSPKVFSISFFVLFTVYTLFAYIKDKNLSPKLVTYINTRVPQTKLNYFSDNISGLGSSIEGVYRGYRLSSEVKNKVGMGLKIGLNTSRPAVRINTKIKVAIEFQKSLPWTKALSILEKKLGWRNISGETLNACFDKRFIVSNNSGLLSPKIKEKLLLFPRNLFITINANQIIFEKDMVKISPFYSLEGEILFFDFLISLCEMLENSND